MEEWQRKLIEHLYNIANMYYTEKTPEGAYKIPDNQNGKAFIQEVFMACAYLLGDIED